MKTKKNYKRRYKAVTLVELLVVISIIGILAGVSAVSLQSARNFSRLKAAQREVASQIKLAQSYALQGRAQSGVTPCGYGFRFKNDGEYEVFYNPKSPSCSSVANHYDSAISQSFESQLLSNGVKLFSPDPAAVGGNETEIYFTVPHGSIYDYAGATPIIDNVLTFRLGSSDKTITISPGGKITES